MDYTFGFRKGGERTDNQAREEPNAPKPPPHWNFYRRLKHDHA
ncbi:hypothetical protein HanXRQr2_Chr17g0809231 [Helianthus annuus]|uniref:Uncharacterized protein n=1 Tax=Helianthus annuus TaxID=4232 RepID=A0A9K3DIM4_HELAN|nr:hypothetical protein HanXRQr2_Chr17g0809231 [Helianthus annuus]KAJ0813698.1 hypothetical protein HanPSC8_Chr17g0776531 [Helianthus annuus]